MNNFLKKPVGIAGLTVLLVIFDQFTKYLAVLFLKDQAHDFDSFFFLFFRI